MISSVLIANRGEIACRIIRSARRLGLRTIAVYSDADALAPFVAMADEAHRIGPAPAGESYLRIDAIIAAAKASGAAAIHPGYGFLSERAEFAEACAEAGIVFVGPPAGAIRAMGLKDAAKALAEKAGVPVVPGYHGERQQPEFLRQKAYEIGYPVLIKAVAGGGGKGMRKVEKVAEFDAALESAQREAMSSFGDARVLVEKYVLAPRHIEVQVFADGHGNVVHMFERDCSLQRRHQKVIEEAPAPGMTAEMREAMGRAAVEAARAVGYVGAGTVEFIADGREGLRPDRFYFMEMNTRLQVEHPVTEEITGLDLVELQLRVASGEVLPFSQDDLKVHGHAVEARLYAEDPEKGFLPSTGRLWALRLPEGEGIRVDTGVEEGDEVTPYYDPMIAKIIAHGATRDEALDRLSSALGDTLVAGPRTNAAFLKALSDSPDFRASRFDTGYIDARLQALGAVAQPPDPAAIAAAALALVEAKGRRIEAEARARGDIVAGPFWQADGFQLGGVAVRGLPLNVDGVRMDAALSFAGGEAHLDLADADLSQGEHHVTLVPAGQGMIALRNGRQTSVELHDPFDVDIEHLDDTGGTVKSPMHGKLIALLVDEGQRVTKGQRVAVVEAMKMEHALVAPLDGLVGEIGASVGAQVGEGARIVTILADEA